MHTEEKSESFGTRIRPHLEFWGLELLILALILGSVVAYLEHVQSVWASPVLYGLGAGLMCSGIWIAIRLGTSIPPRNIQPNSKNIEACVRSWLNNYKVAVKNDPSPDNYFRLRITLDSSSALTILRSKADYPDYVQILCNVGSGGDKTLLSQFSPNDIDQLLFDIKLELARAQIAYGGLVNPPENFHLFRRVPIHHNLTEFVFMGMVGEVEAALHLVVLMYFKAKNSLDKNSKQP